MSALVGNGITSRNHGDPEQSLRSTQLLAIWAYSNILENCIFLIFTFPSVYMCAGAQEWFISRKVGLHVLVLTTIHVVTNINYFQAVGLTASMSVNIFLRNELLGLGTNHLLYLNISAAYSILNNLWIILILKNIWLLTDCLINCIVIIIRVFFGCIGFQIYVSSTQRCTTVISWFYISFALLVMLIISSCAHLKHVFTARGQRQHRQCPVSTTPIIVNGDKPTSWCSAATA